MVYLIFDKNTKLTKIGFSKNPKKRLYVLQTSNPHLILVYSNESLIEKELHKEYRSKRVFREWFRLNLEDYISIIGDRRKLPKTLYYRFGLPKFVTITSKVENLNIDFKLKDCPNYGLGIDKNLYNLTTGNQIKKTIKSGIAGYWIGKDFIKLSELRNKVELIPKETTPF